MDGGDPKSAGPDQVAYRARFVGDRFRGRIDIDIDTGIDVDIGIDIRHRHRIVVPGSGPVGSSVSSPVRRSIQARR